MFVFCLETQINAEQSSPLNEGQFEGWRVLLGIEVGSKLGFALGSEEGKVLAKSDGRDDGLALGKSEGSVLGI